MKNFLLVSFSILLLAVSCKQKEEEVKESFWPVLSLIQSQVAKVDTSLYPIKKITIIDSLHSDTQYVKREEFRGLAKEFLDIPDLMNKKTAKRFTEEKLFDQTLNRVILNYTPKDPDKEEFKKIQVLITPDIATGDKVNNIIIERIINNRDGFLQKNMLWQMDQSFQVTTITQKPGQPENISTIKVSWNDNDE
jgi:hypothetical protein